MECDLSESFSSKFQILEIENSHRDPKQVKKVGGQVLLLHFKYSKTKVHTQIYDISTTQSIVTGTLKVAPKSNLYKYVHTLINAQCYINVKETYSRSSINQRNIFDRYSRTSIDRHLFTVTLQFPINLLKESLY